MAGAGKGVRPTPTTVKYRENWDNIRWSKKTQEEFFVENYEDINRIRQVLDKYSIISADLEVIASSEIKLLKLYAIIKIIIKNLESPHGKIIISKTLTIFKYEGIMVNLILGEKS